MPYINLLNATCRIQRSDFDNSSLNEFNEETDEPNVIADDLPCRLEKLYDRELIEAYAGGDHDKGIYVLYLKIGVDIRASDLIMIYETVKVTGFSDSNINGIYKRTESDVLNNKPVYMQTSDSYRIFFESGVWKIQDVDSGEELYATSGESLNEKNWVVLDGTGTTGKSKNTIIQDFHYNSNDKPTMLIVNDVEDAGGGHHHHLQCFCRYREEID